MAPKSFGESILYETPATDPSNIMGRTVGIQSHQLTGDKTRSHIKIIFKVNKIEGKTASTQFYGLECMPEYVYRNVRAGLQKMEAIDTVDTKDGWKLQLTVSIILNKKTESEIQKKSRNFVIDYLRAEAAKSTIDEFIKPLTAGSYQKKLKKDASKVYPVRFLEIGKVEVLKMGNEGSQ